MDVLVVGGTGLISTGITRQLVADGHDVTCFTRGETEARVPSEVSFVHGNRTNREQFDEQVADLDVDVVVDAICFDPDTAAHAVETFAGEIEQYVFCSTVDVYRRPLPTNPVDESAPRETDVDGATPVSEYAENKSAAEDVFLEAHDRGDFATTVIRPWSTYGEGGPVLHTLGTSTAYVDRIRRGEPIVVHGDGQTLWGPCHRDDVARAFVNAVGNPTSYGEAYHVTSDEVLTWRQYHETVARALDAPTPEFVFVPTDVLLAARPEATSLLRDHLQFSTVFDTSKARRDLDFEYAIDFETGVQRTVAWLDEHDAIEPWDSRPDDVLIDAWRDATDEFLADVSVEQS